MALCYRRWIIRRLGQPLQRKHNLADYDILWIVGLVTAILRALGENQGRPMSHIARGLGISRQKLYTYVHWAVDNLVPHFSQK